MELKIGYNCIKLKGSHVGILLHHMVLFHRRGQDRMVHGKKVKGKEILSYSIGGLLYMPAVRTDIAEVICTKKYEGLSSVCICLEDSIADSSLALAEKQLVETLTEISSNVSAKDTDFSLMDLPLIFVRVRNEKHLRDMHSLLNFGVPGYSQIVCGYVLPKFDTTNMVAYLKVADDINRGRNEGNYMYMLPIFETKQIIDMRTSIVCLGQLKEELDKRDYILGIRTGGNDFSNLYGIRRSVDQTIYDNRIIGNALCNIMNIFGRRYVISGPVWEYFDTGDGNAWKEGLKNELDKDRINGFIGKTVIHPSQLLPVRDSLTVSRCDYEDAVSVLQDNDEKFGVHKSQAGRMNETKTHQNWAKKILVLAKVWGIGQDTGQKDGCAAASHVF